MTSRSVLLAVSASMVAVVVIIGITSTANEDSSNMAGEVRLELIAEGFTSPVGLVSPGDGSGRLFVVDQIGTISIITAGKAQHRIR